MRSRVVLPQPDGPSRQTKVPCGDVEVDMVDRGHVPNRFVSPSRARPVMGPVPRLRGGSLRSSAEAASRLVRPGPAPPCIAWSRSRLRGGGPLRSARTHRA